MTVQVAKHKLRFTQGEEGFPPSPGAHLGPPAPVCTLMQVHAHRPAVLMWNQRGLFTVERSCPDWDISVGLKHWWYCFFFSFFLFHLAPIADLSSDHIWLIENPEFISVKTRERWHLFQIPFQRKKAFHLELSCVGEKKKINKLLFFELVACSVFTNVSFLLSLLTNGDCLHTVICSRCVL